MIAFGCAITDEDTYARLAAPGIAASREADSAMFMNVSAGSIFRNYNKILEQARELGGLEALVLLHQDAIIEDPGFKAKVREAIAEPEVAIVGCAGAIDVRNIAWWEGSVKWASFTHRYDEMGGGEIAAMNWHGKDSPAFAGLGEVETVDGFMMAFSPWAIENLRFDESLPGGLHGYDFDICMQARAAGKKVVVADLKVAHHHSLDVVSDISAWVHAHMTLAEKWQDRLPANDQDIGRRVRRAEAELSSSIMGRASDGWITDIRISQLEAELEAVQRSLSWRITRPLRWLNARLGGGS